MQDPADYDLHPTEAAPPAVTRARARWPWVVGLAAVAAIVVAAVIVWHTGWPGSRGDTAVSPDARPSPQAAASPYTAPVEPAGALGAPADPVYLPPLGETDHVVRPLVSVLSSHPRVLRLLATDGLIRRFTASVDNIATGQTPAVHLQTIRPAGTYQFIDAEDVVLADPQSYRRYDELANAFASIDARETARLYTVLKPRIEDAYRELGRIEPFDRALEQAIVSLLKVPTLQGEILLEPKGALFRYADPAVEALTPAQKQLLRMGPRNVRLVQAKLREVAAELGIPRTRLPA